MLSWLFKKRGPAAASTAAPKPLAGAKSAKSIPAQTAAPAAPPPAPAVDEGPLLRAALGDDAALLRLAQSASTLATKLAAVEALAGEAALRQAERAFRSHDRKVHRVAKQRLEAAVTRREAQAQAQALLERTRGLMAEALVPVNHLVEIDRAWAALPADALAGELQQGYTSLRAELDARMRAQDEAQRQLQRWTAEARQQIEAAPRALATTAAEGSAQEAARLAAALAALRDARPELPATAALDAALAQMQQTALQVQAWLAPLESTASTEEARVPETPQAVETAADVAPTPEPPRPAPAPTTATAAAADLPPALASVLAARQAAWQRARQPAAPAVAADEVAPVVDAAPRTPQDEARRAARQQRLDSLVQQAEAALADGQLGVLQQRLQAIEHTLTQAHAAPPEGLRARLQALQAERGRLKAWQQWGGARARDDLLSEAEALARQTLAAAPPEAAPASEGVARDETAGVSEAAEPCVTAAPAAAPEASETAGPPTADEVGAPPEPPSQPAESSTPKRTRAPRPPPPVKLNLKQHADGIQSLRRRWKALDHQGAVASAEQWRRFDAALQLAHEPVARQQAALKAARQDNLAAREALLSALEAGPAAQAAAQATASDAATEAPAGERSSPTPPDWRACSAELDRFQTAWRKLGPVEHTVPAAARDALLQRLSAALARVEAPLQQARATAAAEREQLIAQAERLLPPPGGRPAPESTRQVRELQAAWQDHARHLPLPRGLETALWARFKAATDAVFTQREAAFAARDAELAANLAAAQALVERLAALASTSLPAEIQRTLAEVDRAWRQGGELPRGAIDALEARYHAARSAAAALLNAGQQQRWQARCDALAARLSLCEAREDGAADADALATLDARWAASEALPAPWQQALAQRWAQPPGAGPLAGAEVDELLLRLEAAFNLPSAPAWQAARQQLKLLALKDTMEGRTPVQAGPQQNAGGLQALLRQAGLDAAQRARLHALVAALRAAQPGVVGLPAEQP